jgi:hypothetical protein
MTDAPPPVTDQQLRDAGYTANARNYPRTERAVRWLARFNGVPFKRVPAAWWYAPNAYMLAYVEQKATEEAQDE